MLRVTITNANKVATGLSKDVDQIVRQVSQELLKQLQRFTPVRSGRAKRGYRLNKRKKYNYEVVNRVPYIERLDEGYSKQSPNGMTRPAIRAVSNKRIRRFTR